MLEEIAIARITQIYGLSGHYKWALDQLFYKHKFSRVIILEGAYEFFFSILSSLFVLFTRAYLNMQMIWKFLLISLTFLRLELPSWTVTSEVFGLSWYLISISIYVHHQFLIEVVSIC